MEKKKLEVSEDLKNDLYKLRELLKDINILDNDMTQCVIGGCGGLCNVTCSYYCEEQCEASCAFTSEMFDGRYGDFCAAKPMPYPYPPLP